MKALSAAFGAGVVFALGLVISGMTLPSKIIGFLDVLGAWDPSLALVMGGAVSVMFGAQRWILRTPKPRLSPMFLLPTRTDVDRRLVVGAALFGVGWGLAGYCPGPGITSLGGAREAWVFVVSMLAGMGLFSVYEGIRRPPVTARSRTLASTPSKPGSPDGVTTP